MTITNTSSAPTRNTRTAPGTDLEVVAGTLSDSSVPSCPFDPTRWAPVCISPEHADSTSGRLVAATVEGDAVCLAMDLRRSRNQQLMTEAQLRVTRPGDGEADFYVVDDVEPLSGAAYDAAARRTSGPLGRGGSLVHAHKVDRFTTPIAESVSAKKLPLVVPIASPEAVQRTRPIVDWLTRRLSGPVEYVYVSTPEMASSDEVADFATEVLAQVALGIDARARVIVTNDVTGAIVAACRDRLTCMETHAAAFRRSTFVDSFAAAVLAVSNAPVVLIGPAFDPSVPLTCRGLEIALAGEDHEAKVLDAAMLLASRLGVPAGVIHVDSAAPALSTVPAKGGRSQPVQIPIAVTTVVEQSDGLARTLIDAAGDCWLAVGTQARRGLERIAEGSVAFDIAACASSPVIAFGPTIDAVATQPADMRQQAVTRPTLVDSVESLTSLVMTSALSHETVDAVMTPAPNWLDGLDALWG